MKTYPVLTRDKFIAEYGSDVGNEAKFITKAYSHADDTVAIFPKETKVDCYFQLPKWKEDTVPDDRRYIYVLPKDSIPASVLIDGERYKIRVTELKIYKDPYMKSSILEEDDGLNLGKNDTKMEKLVIKVLKDLINQYESRN